MESMHEVTTRKKSMKNYSVVSSMKLASGRTKQSAQYKNSCFNHDFNFDESPSWLKAASFNTSQYIKNMKKTYQ